MKLTCLAHIIPALLCAGVVMSAPAPTPVVSQVHVVSIHVPDHAAYDAVFLLLRDVIQLPRVYGELSKPGSKENRLYSGFSVGNAYLEPCGPYSSDAPFTTNRPARFHGLTCSTATSFGEDVEELTRRGISHSGVSRVGSIFLLTQVSDTALQGKLLSLGLWELQDKKDHLNLDGISNMLRQAKGGPLGVTRLDEVRVGYAGQTNLNQWANFLAPAKRTGDVWFIGNGPALRLVPSPENQIESIVLQVESLEKAKAILVQKRLIGKASRDAIELDPAKTCGLRILLKEK